MKPIFELIEEHETELLKEHREGAKPVPVDPETLKPIFDLIEEHEEELRNNNLESKIRYELQFLIENPAYLQEVTEWILKLMERQNAEQSTTNRVT